ncbi:MAG: sigma-70 family RNA polymerase sigma factor, partial [Saprospiraceae bacterium]|nr:sigma-70 family RNA polymerase sigma factor [Saprospiraceae bacterium]
MPTRETKKMSEEELVALLHNNKRVAIQPLLDKYGDALYGVVLNIVHAQELAEDVMQETFVKVWKNADSYNAEKGRLFTWLVNIARYTAIDKIRTVKFKENQKTISLDRTVYENEQLSEEMEVQDVGLRAVINSLEEKYRSLIDLLYLQGFTQTEAAEALNIPLGTVKTRSITAIAQ